MTMIYVWVGVIGVLSGTKIKKKIYYFTSGQLKQNYVFSMQFLFSTFENIVEKLMIVSQLNLSLIDT